MSNKKKLLVGLAATLLVLLVIFAIVFPYLAPRLINSQAIKTKIEATISQRIGGRVQFESVGFAVFPLPHIVINRGILSIADAVTGSVKSLAAYPELMPLLKGHLQVDKLQLEAPELFIKLPFPTETPIDIEGIKREFFTSVKALAANVSDLDVDIDKGRLTLTTTDGSLLSFAGIDAAFEFTPKRFEIELDSKSNLAEKVNVQLTVEPGPLSVKGSLGLGTFHPLILSRYVPTLADYRIIEPIQALKMDFRTEGDTALLAKIISSKLNLTAFKQGQQTTIVVKSLQGSIEVNENTRFIALDKLELESPRVTLSGALKMHSDTPKIDLILKADDVDVSSTRTVALALAGNDPDVQDISRYVRAGTIPSMTVTSHGKSWEELDEKEALVIEGKLIDGQITVPEIDLAFDKVAGDVFISRGILQGSNVTARLEGSQISHGAIKIGLSGQDPPLHIEMDLETDLSTVPPLLGKLVNNRDFLRELNRVTKFEGKVLGKLSLGDRMDSVTASVHIADVKMSAHHELLPYPLQINSGRFSYKDGNIGVQTMHGRMGKSSFSNLTGSLNLERAHFLTIESGRASLASEEIYPWLLSFKKPGAKLDAVIATEGTLSITSMDFKGPLLTPETWRYNLKGGFDDLVIQSKQLPGSLQVTSGTFETRPDRINVDQIDAQISDARGKISGTLPSPLGANDEVKLTLSGKLGSQMTAWISGLLELPPQLHLQSPISLAPSQVQWRKGKQASFKGNMTIKNDLRLSLDVAVTDRELNLHKLAVRDKESNATLELHRREKEYTLNFKGKITQNTTRKILVHTPLQKAWIQGDFRARIFPDHPMNSRAHGALEAKDLVFQSKLNVPVVINHMALRATGKELDFTSLTLTWEKHQGQIQGSVGASEDAFILNLVLTLDQLDWEALEAGFTSESEKNNRGQSPFWDLPVRGTVHVNSDSFTFGNFRWRPFRVGITRSKDTVEAEIREAKLCGVSFPGTITVGREDLALDFSLLAKEQDYETTTRCLGFEGRQAIGTFDFNGKVTAQGQSGDLAKGAHGPLELNLKNGRIYESSLLSKVLAKVLALVNVTELFRGRVPDLRKEGFAFDSIIAKGNLKTGKIHVTEFVVDGASMDIVGTGEIDLVSKKVNLKLFVAPFKTINLLTQRTPIINKILGGNILSVPITVKGDIGNPEVSGSSK